LRLLLDAHISARRVAVPLREQGHEVRAADQERALDGWGDERLLKLARAENRVMVTFNARDYVRIARRWAAAGNSHAGLLVVVGIDTSEFGLILRRLAETFASHPSQADWVNAVRITGRHR
jgi:predicted nuclease of predicted toxin-antitoxin system